MLIVLKVTVTVSLRPALTMGSHSHTNVRFICHRISVSIQLAVSLAPLGQDSINCFHSFKETVSAKGKQISNLIHLIVLSYSVGQDA